MYPALEVEKSTMKLGGLEMDPVRNPGVLDTGAWAPGSAWPIVKHLGDWWLEVYSAGLSGAALPHIHTVHPVSTSCGRRGSAMFVLVDLSDGQQVFVELGNGGGADALGPSLGTMSLSNGLGVRAYPTDSAVVHRYVTFIKPESGPRPWGALPRLGIGVRMTSSVWPGIYDAMRRCGFAANTIQNSVRELALLADVLECRPAPTNYACGFGAIETGYTGSTWEGLWVSGVLYALHREPPLRYGADADHIQVKRGEDGLSRAKTIINAAKYYTFYTLDMADILDYAALDVRPSQSAGGYLAGKIPDSRERRMVLAYHTAPARFGGNTYTLDETLIDRLVGKYWEALGTLEILAEYISALKCGNAYDLEFTMDEHSPEVAAFDCLTSAEELLFVLREIRRRGLPVTHVAPNFGQEKSYDYRCPDGLDGLERRIRNQFILAEEFGVLLDFHSADDLTAAPRGVIQKATGGRHHYKISPMLQLLFAEVLQRYHPGLFLEWWDDAMAYALSEAQNGSAFARHCLDTYASSADKAPSRHHMIFHHYSFRFVGRRDAQGNFLNRDAFYSLSPEFYRSYRECIADYLTGLANELF